MCQQTLTPSLCPTCSLLHVAVSSRSNCRAARGPCICVFATCGRPTETTAAEVPVADVPSAACSTCYARNMSSSGADAGSGPMLLGSILRGLVADREVRKYLDLLASQPWHAEQCES